MSSQQQKANDFRTLHVPGRPIVLFNIWDPGSAKAVVASGAKAIATGSWSVAAANGYGDGEKIPLDFAIDNLARIVRATELPVSIDIESGYGKTPEDVARTIQRTIEAGAIGCNIEDSFPENGKLRDVNEQTQRIRAAREASDASGIPYFINARTDVFFQKSADQHDDGMLQDAISRAAAYAEAGASGIFVPGLINAELMARLTKATKLPVNIMVGKNTPSLDVLANAGIARVSHGPGPYLAAMQKLKELAQIA